MRAGALVHKVGCLVAAQCDAYVSKRCATYSSSKLADVVRESRCHKARLLHYFPLTADQCATAPPHAPAVTAYRSPPPTVRTHGRKPALTASSPQMPLAVPPHAVTQGSGTQHQPTGAAEPACTPPYGAGSTHAPETQMPTTAKPPPRTAAASAHQQIAAAAMQHTSSSSAEGKTPQTRATTAALRPAPPMQQPHAHVPPAPTAAAPGSQAHAPAEPRPQTQDAPPPRQTPDAGSPIAATPAAEPLHRPPPDADALIAQPPPRPTA